MSRRPVLAACALAAGLGLSVPPLLAGQGDDTDREAARASAVQTALPGLGGSPKADIVSAALPGLQPTRGQVGRAAGPFDDRFALTDLALDRGVVSGTVTVTSDVSEVIDLQVLVGFYDAGGTYLGSATFEKHGEDTADVNERVPFRVAAPSNVAAAVASAAVGIPVLVNE